MRARISPNTDTLRSGYKRNVETIPDLSAIIQDVTAIREIKLL